MYIFCLIFLAAFGVVGGMFIGAGNRAGIVCALVCGTVTGLLLNAPFFLDGDRPSNVVLFLAAVAGAVAIKFVADEHPLKKFFREQKGLRVDLGARYRIGSE
ncbi:MAG: hypothetical protein JSS83_26965 [Cyanobacteria bacterium SZAS LIN-3]|nr:hypothetical protein [Cyanobacteria bacterium SZAS LIN-3]MBS2009778.1 hypothetical protein [Cyanobacteria bacterium SZAS TMP-1]